MDSYLTKQERLLVTAISKSPARIYDEEGDDRGITKYGCGLIKRWIDSLPFPPKDDISTAKAHSFSFRYNEWLIELRKHNKESYYSGTQISWQDVKLNDKVSQCFIPSRYTHRSTFMRDHLERLVPAVRDAILEAKLKWHNRVDNSLTRLMSKWAPLMVLDTMLHGSVISGSDAETGDKVKALLIQVERIVRDWRLRLLSQYPAAFRTDLKLFRGLFEFDKSDMKFRIPKKGTVYFPLASHHSQEVLTQFLRCFPALMKPLEDRVAQVHVDCLKVSLAKSIASPKAAAHYMASSEIRAIALRIHNNLCEKRGGVNHVELS